MDKVSLVTGPKDCSATGTLDTLVPNNEEIIRERAVLGGYTIATGKFKGRMLCTVGLLKLDMYHRYILKYYSIPDEIVELESNIRRRYLELYQSEIKTELKRIDDEEL